MWGERSGRVGDDAALWKHPHLCGENNYFNKGSLTTYETPPPVWGEHHCTTGCCHPERNTPTCVGRTGIGGGNATCARKHPHLCGENGTHRQDHCSRSETPPPVWGERRSTCRLPAAHGKHPHLCGENTLPPPSGKSVVETPPPVWGEHQQNVVEPLL